MRIRSKRVDLYSHIMPSESYPSLRRFELLENAVINYSGGLLNLEVRIRSVLNRKPGIAVSSDDIDAEVIMLLRDISVYLRDIKKHTELGGKKTSRRL